MRKDHEGSRKSTWRLQTQYDVYIMKQKYCTYAGMLQSFFLLRFESHIRHSHQTPDCLPSTQKISNVLRVQYIDLRMANESKKTCLCLSTTRGWNRMYDDPHPSGRQGYRMYMMVMMVPWRDYLKQVLLFHYFPIVSFSTGPVSPALISSPLAHLLLWTPQQPSSEGSITMKQETHIANRFYQSPRSFPTGAWSMPSLGCGQCLVQVLRISVTKFQTCQSVTRIPEQMEGILM